MNAATWQRLGWEVGRGSSSLARRGGAAAAAWLGVGARQQQHGRESGRTNHRLSARGSGRLARAAQLGLPTERSAWQAAKATAHGRPRATSTAT